MKYVVGFTDEKTGIFKFRGYDHKNDAIGFIVLHSKKNLKAQLYEAVATQITQPKILELGPTVPCPVCHQLVKSLTDSGWCVKCAKMMDEA